MITAIVISVALALIGSSLLLFVFNRRVPGPGRGMLYLFLIILLFSWAGGAWIHPADSSLTWAGYAVVAFLVILLLGALLPRLPKGTSPRGSITTRVTSQDLEQREEEAEALDVTFGLFFWLLLLALLATGIAGSYYNI
ncbi:MAG TPA: hypothetical protein VIN07_02025 [Flavipsychrobacter sp.]